MKTHTLLKSTLAHLVFPSIAIFAVVILGEVIFRGVHDTLAWVTTYPWSLAITLGYLLLWFYALQTLFSRAVSISILACLTGGFSWVNYTKFAKLGVPVLPSDLTLSRQYMQAMQLVWGNAGPVVAVIFVLILLSIIWLYRHRLLRSNNRKMYSRTLGVVLAIVAVSLAVMPDYSSAPVRFRGGVLPGLLNSLGINNHTWSPQLNVRENGQLLSFLLNIRSAGINVPDGYSTEKVRGELDALRASQRKEVIHRNAKNVTATDIIVIMNEAFWDPRLMNEVSYSDLLLEKLKATSRGVLFSPVYGGYTANTEFEFLTRLSTSYLPVGSIPYQQYVNRPIPTLASEIRAAGYTTTAIHPYEPGMWRRSQVYPLFGFERFISIDEARHRELTPPFISDASVANEIISVINDTPEKNHFIFAVTIQNHGPYSDGETRYHGKMQIGASSQTKRLGQISLDYLSTYSTGVKDAVESFNAIVKQCETSGRNTIVVMFGDHLPFLGDHYSVYKDAGFISSVDRAKWSTEEHKKMHSVPVIAWTNLPVEISFPNQAFSPVFLGSMIKRAAGINDMPIDILLDKVKGEYLVLANFYSMSTGGKVTPGPPPETEANRLYQNVIYETLFGAGM